MNVSVRCLLESTWTTKPFHLIITDNAKFFFLVTFFSTIDNSSFLVSRLRYPKNNIWLKKYKKQKLSHHFTACPCSSPRTSSRTRICRLLYTADPVCCGFRQQACCCNSLSQIFHCGVASSVLGNHRRSCWDYRRCSGRNLVHCLSANPRRSAPISRL